MKKIQLENRRNLTTIERERIVQLTDVINSDKVLLGNILIKYLQFNAEDILNSKGEFWQTYDDIRNTMMTGLRDDALREQLKRLVKSGYITYGYKGIEDDKMYRKAIHLKITDKALETIMSDSNETKINSKEKYEILQEVRYKNKPKKEFTPKVFDTEAKRVKQEKRDTPNISSTDDKTIEITSNDKQVLKPIEPTREPLNVPNEHTPTKANKEPKATVKPIDNSEVIGLNFEYNDNSEVIGIGFEDDEMIDNDVKEVIRPVKEPIKERTEPIDNDNKAIEELNDKQPTEPIKERKTAKELNRAKAKSIIDNKTNPKIKDYLDKLRLTNYDIHFLLSDGYTDGSNKDLDDKKRILNLIADNLIKVHK